MFVQLASAGGYDATLGDARVPMTVARPTARRRPKRPARRIGRELRLLAPWLGLLVETALLALAIVVVERAVPAVGAAAPADYLAPTTSSSSTSNVSVAPPGMTGGEPLSP